MIIQVNYLYVWVDEQTKLRMTRYDQRRRILQDLSANYNMMRRVWNDTPAAAGEADPWGFYYTIARQARDLIRSNDQIVPALLPVTDDPDAERFQVAHIKRAMEVALLHHHTRSMSYVQSMISHRTKAQVIKTYHRKIVLLMLL